MLTFARESITEYISKCNCDEIKFNVIKSSSKKGAVLTRFNICNTSMCFVNSHLATGKDNISARLSDIKKIFKEGFQKDRLDRIKDNTIEDTD